jgi:hypothetical protein
VDRIYLAHNRDWWQALVMNSRKRDPSWVTELLFASHKGVPCLFTSVATTLTHFMPAGLFSTFV